MTEQQFKLLYDELREINRKLSGVTMIAFGTHTWECQHEYPSVWHGTAPPSCLKCGKPGPSMSPTYSSTTT